MNEEEIMEKVMKVAEDSRISCKDAWDLAQQAGIENKEMGELLDKFKIKIFGCQLGCF
jgi:hypothetical protein